MQQHTALLTVAVNSGTWNLQQHLKIHTAAGDHRYVMSFLAWLWRQTSDASVKMWLEGTVYFNCIYEVKWTISGCPTWSLRPKCNTWVWLEATCVQVKIWVTFDITTNLTHKSTFFFLLIWQNLDCCSTQKHYKNIEINHTVVTKSIQFLWGEFSNLETSQLY